MSGPAEAAAHLRRLGLEGVFRTAWAKVGRYGVAGRLPTAGLDAAQLQALESVLGRRVTARRPVEVAWLDAALRRSPFACGIEEVAAAWFGPPPETQGAGAARRAAEAEGFLDRGVPAWTAAGVPPAVAAAVLRREFLRALRAGPGAVADLQAAVEAVAGVLGDPPYRRGDAALLGILANRATGDPHAFDAGTVGGRLLLGALGAPPGAGALARQEVLARVGIAVDGISSTVAVCGIGPDGERGGPADAVLVAPLRSVLRWALPAATWAGAPVHVVENPPVLEALVERGLPPGAALVCTAGFPSAAAVRLLGALARAGAAVRYSGDFDGNGLQIAERVLGMGGGAWSPWRMAPEDFAASVAVARGRAVREPDERRALEGLTATATLAATAGAILETGTVAYQESLVGALWSDVWAAHPAT